MMKINTSLQLALVVGALALVMQLAPTPSEVTAQAEPPPDVACIGNEVGRYIDRFFNDSRTDNFQHIKFITPVFNMTSPYFNEVVTQIASNVSPANWAKFDFVGGNAYNFQNGPYIRDWVTAARANQYIGSRPMVLTEIGWYEILQGSPTSTALANLTNEINWIKSGDSNVTGALIFNVFNNNPGWSQYSLSDDQLNTACSGNCGNIGANSAVYYSSSDSDFYGRAGGHGMGFTIEIANNDTNPSLPSVMPGIQSAHSRGMTPIVRIGVMEDSGGFDDPLDYVTFLQRLDSMVSQDVYVIVGPNEPETECWGSRPCFSESCAANPGAQLSCSIIPWQPVDATLPLRDVTCACTEGGTTICNPFADQITFGRPTRQDSGQADGTGTGSYNFYDNDTQSLVYVPPIIGAISDGSVPSPPGAPPSGNCLACPILSITRVGYAYCDSTFYGDNHRGTDYIASSGAAIFAVTDGNISQSGWGEGYGYRIVLQGNDGNTYIYGHLHPDSMPATGPVTANQQIGAVGPLCLPANDPNVPGCSRTNDACAGINANNCTNGTSSIAHLHFEARPPGVGYGTSCNEQLDPQSITPSECFGSCTSTGSCQGGSSTINCNVNATFDPTMNNVKPIPELIAAIQQTGYAAQTDYEHIEMCYNDVISRAQNANVDPAFAMAIWIEESGASNYCMFPTVADFGCAVTTPRANFSSQINCLLGLPQQYASYGSTFAQCRDGYCPPGVSDLTVLKFLQTYSGGPGACVDNNFGNNPNFYSQIRAFYQVAHKDNLEMNDYCVLPSNDWSANCSPVSSCTLYP